MSTRHKLVLSAVAGVSSLVIVALSTVIGAAPASAHGATLNPVSRAEACGPEGGANEQSAACEAATEANDGQPITDFDNIRVPNVNGRDREVIPDGKLCSAGIDRFKGLDLVRPDWPSTKVTSGAAFTFRYRVTIPHAGSFRFFVTKDTYDPSQPMRWAALQAQPFATFPNPVAANGVYTLPGTMPVGKVGHHVIYTIWQTTSTPDTYYSCSDVIFTAAARGSAAAGAGAGKSSGAATASAGGQPAIPAQPPLDSGQATPPSGANGTSPSGAASGAGHQLRLTAGVPGGAVGLAAGGGAVLLLVLGSIFAMVSLRRRRNPHIGRHASATPISSLAAAGPSAIRPSGTGTPSNRR